MNFSLDYGRCEKKEEKHVNFAALEGNAYNHCIPLKDKTDNGTPTKQHSHNIVKTQNDQLNEMKNRL